MVLLTLVKVLLALVPRAVMATMHTTIIGANITAYSDGRQAVFTLQEIHDALS